MSADVPSTVFYAKLSKGVRSIVTEISISGNGKIIQINGKWDTGAYITCIPWRVIEELDLDSRGIEEAHGTFDEIKAYDTYVVDLTVSGGHTFKDLRVIGLPKENTTDHVLIGMDVISQGDFLISGYGDGMFSFRAPSTKSVSLSFI